MEAIILAGGRGTRLKSAVWDVPKCLAPINGKPFLSYLLKYLSMVGIDRFVISVGYKKGLVKKAFEASPYKIIWSEEDLPLGTAGATKQALTKCINRNVFVINGDTLFMIDPFSMMQFHRRNLSLVTVALKQTKPFGAINGGFTLMSTAVGMTLENGKNLEESFCAPKAYLSNEYFIDIGNPENYMRAQNEFLKFE